jgi:pilus assembly protein CpaF
VRAADPALLERVRTELAREPGPVTPGRVAAAVRSAGAVLGDVGLLDVVDALRAELVGAGPLEPLLADERVTDVLVNADRGVWVDRGRGLERVRLDLGGTAAVRRLAVRLAAAAGRRLDDASPYVDARLPGGVRVHAVLPPLAEGGTHLSLRVPHRHAMTLDELVDRGALPPDWAPWVAEIVSRRLAFVVTGGTGAGKTTVLAALLGRVPPAERIVLVEDCAELAVDHPHVVRLEARPANVEGRGAVSLTDLVRQALRMRPDRLVVGECRGAEIVDLLGALNTGHDGGAGTLHANAPSDVPARLEALGLLGGLPRAALHAQVVAALQVVLQVRRTDRGRALESVSVLLPSGEQRLATVVPAWRRGRGAGPGAGALSQWLVERGVVVPAVLRRPS